MSTDLTTIWLASDPIFALGEGTKLLISDIQANKYRYNEGELPETEWIDTLTRMAKGIFPADPEQCNLLIQMLLMNWIVPAGRIMAGAGTEKQVTWINCFVAQKLLDSMRSEDSGVGIMDCLRDVAFSMQMGGGVGTDFSPLRPNNAYVHRTRTKASGVLHFMDMWDGMCGTIESAGERRGAMMATLRIDHPDVWNARQFEADAATGRLLNPSFISAKRQKGRLTFFNMSVLVTKDFMKCKEEDGIWQLGHWCRPWNKEEVKAVIKKINPDTGLEQDWYVYVKVPARMLWDDIMRSTYVYAEPGVIFIDRVNEYNNLYYCETISCTNPCGEQPLPPNGDCNLSALFLGAFVINPFSDRPYIHYGALKMAVHGIVRMLDNVLDYTPFPIPAQREEAVNKRRIGLGVTGLATMLMFMTKRYGSPSSLSGVRTVMQFIRDEAYSASIQLAVERGPFPLFDRDKYLQGKFIKTLPDNIQAGIREHGIRNSLLLTIAPTGTSTIAQAFNCSSGLEPVFDPAYTRNVVQRNGTSLPYVVEDFGFRVYANKFHNGNMAEALQNLPDYMVTTADLTPDEHLHVQAACQEFIDASVSKTINVRADCPFEDFAEIYQKAWDWGCKGCTTYRPDPTSGRGAVLTSGVASPVEGEDLVQWVRALDQASADEAAKMLVPGPLYQKLHTLIAAPTLRKRPFCLEGSTYKLEWPDQPSIFLIVNDEALSDGSRLPFEVFVQSKNVTNAHLWAAITRMISAVMKKGGDIQFIPEELEQIHSARGGQWIKGSYIPSEIAYVGVVLRQHYEKIGLLPKPGSSEMLKEIDNTLKEIWEVPLPSKAIIAIPGAGHCPQCGYMTLIHQEGCDLCRHCDYSTCG